MYNISMHKYVLNHHNIYGNIWDKKLLTIEIYLNIKNELIFAVISFSCTKFLSSWQERKKEYIWHLQQILCYIHSSKYAAVLREYGKKIQTLNRIVIKLRSLKFLSCHIECMADIMDNVICSFHTKLMHM